MYKELCKGGCGETAKYNGWCKIKWQKGKRFCINCPKIEEKRSKAISLYRITEAKLKNNPMQNPLIAKKNHSDKRNKHASEALKKLGEKGLLPQQIESFESKEKRKNNIRDSLKRLWLTGTHPRQLESINNRKDRLNKMANTLRKLGEKGLLPIQNMSDEQRKIFGNKISLTLREGIKSGRIKLSPSWKKVPYKNLTLRSNWERIVAEFLDKNNLQWQYEALKIEYWDSQRQIMETTIPDFYIPSTNTIIEVKSNAEYNSQKTKDKIKGIINKGFNFILVGKKGIDSIKNGINLLKIGGYNNEKS